MAYVCLNCGTVLESFVMKKVEHEIGSENLSCPITTCSGYVIEVDELFLPIITLLNNKGYTTQYCCSGHYYHNTPNSYIMFSEDTDLPNLPVGWAMDEVTNSFIGKCTIRRYFDKSKDYIEMYKDILDNAKTTLEWAKKLPCNEDSCWGN
jgi:hypothetical protein